MNVLASLFNSLQPSPGGTAAPEAPAELLSGLEQQNLGTGQEDFASLLSQTPPEEKILDSQTTTASETLALPGLSFLSALLPLDSGGAQASQWQQNGNQTTGLVESAALAPLTQKVGTPLPKQNDQELLLGQKESGFTAAQSDKLMDQASSEPSSTAPSTSPTGPDIQQLIMSSPLVQALTSRSAASQGLVDGSQIAKDVQKAGGLTEYLDTPVNIKDFLQKLGVPDQALQQILSGTRAMTESATPRMILEEAGIPVKVFEGLAKSLNMKSPANALAVPGKSLSNTNDTQHQSNLKANLPPEQQGNLAAKVAKAEAPALGLDLPGKGTQKRALPLHLQNKPELDATSIRSTGQNHSNMTIPQLANSPTSVSLSISVPISIQNQASNSSRHGARDLFQLQQGLGFQNAISSLTSSSASPGTSILSDSTVAVSDTAVSMVANTQLPGTAYQTQSMSLQSVGFSQGTQMQTISAIGNPSLEGSTDFLSHGDSNLQDLASVPLVEKNDHFLKQDEHGQEQGGGESPSGLLDASNMSQVGLNTATQEFSLFEKTDATKDSSHSRTQGELDINPILEKVMNASQSLINRNGGQINLQIPSDVYGEIGIQIQVEKEQVRLKIASLDKELKESLNGAMDLLQANLKGKDLQLVEVSFAEASGQSLGNQTSGQDQGRFAWDQGMRDYVDADTGLPELQELLGKAGKIGPFGRASSQYKMPMGQNNSQIHLLT